MPVVRIAYGFLLCVCIGFATGARGSELLKGPVPYGEILALSHTPATEVSYGQDPLQTAYFWAPGNTTSGVKPVSLLYIHGGCWLNAYDIKHSLPLTSALAARGYPVWSIEYRRTGHDGGGWPGSYMDIIAAIDSLAAHPLNEGRQLLLIGHSAGGHLAVLAAGTRPEIKGVVGLAAITHLAEYAVGENSCQKATPEFMGGTPDAMPGRYQSADPFVQPRHKNTILLHGEGDTIVPIAHSELDGSISTTVPEAGHFDWLHPASRAFSTLTDTLDSMLDDNNN